MELKFERTLCRCMRSILRETKNLEQTQELRLPDGMPDIGRVVGAWGQIMLRSKEWRGDGISASGGVTVWVMYVPEDGSDVQCVDVWVPFQAKWDFSETDRDGVIRLFPLLRSADARTVSARKLMIRVGIGLLAEALIPYEVDIYQPSEDVGDIELLRHTYPVKLLKEAREKTFLLDEELMLPGSCEPIDKLMRYEMLPQLVESRVMAGKVVFRGNGLLHILYRGENGTINTWNFEIPFSQFEELEEEFSSDADARIALALTSLELDQMEDGSLRLKCGLVAQCVIEDKMIMEIAEDAYSPRKEVTPCFQEVFLPAVLEERADPTAGEVTLEAECARVLDLSFMPDHPTVNRRGDCAVIGQTGVFQVLYMDTAGGLQTSLRRWEQEFTLNAANDSAVSTCICPNGFPTAQGNSGSISVKGSIDLKTYTESLVNQKMISAVEIGEEKRPDKNRPSVILRRVEGETLWDMAKCCGTTVRAICQVNGLNDEPDPGKMLLIPVL